ncbi:hypothetical protein COCNU_03G012700 [Cocos nucifera]|uniref:Uncharacterized protein n=1 Tax=Cocos nucifera TaxID=13894 RepID=A0A8K0I4D5_COCNU|nr:hypothetical protein COCNU_03G012700 [Cocos nucifera]
MSGSGMASMAGQGVAKAGPMGGSGVPQKGKERASSFQVQSHRPRGGADSEVMPEWKLKLLYTEHGVPPTMSGSLHLGGCF